MRRYDACLLDVAVVSSGANGIGVSPWDRMLSVLMEEVSVSIRGLDCSFHILLNTLKEQVAYHLFLLQDTGICGSNKCYLKDGNFQYVFNQGESIVDPHDRCYKYTCEVSSRHI